MSKLIAPTEALATFVGETMVRTTPLQQRIIAETAELPEGGMLSTADTSALLALLARLIGARRVLEIGTFVGYTALTVAQSLPADGEVIVCEVSEQWAEVARRNWQQGEFAARIELQSGPAAETLAHLLADGQAGTFDMAYIDADKDGYASYYELCVQLLRSGGVVALDNMLWSGQAAEEHPDDATGVALRALNLRIRDDERVDPLLLTVGDGVLVARKR